MCWSDFRVPAEEGLRNAPQKTAFGRSFVDIGEDRVPIAESLKLGDGMSLVHKAGGKDG